MENTRSSISLDQEMAYDPDLGKLLHCTVVIIQDIKSYNVSRK